MRGRPVYIVWLRLIAGASYRSRFGVQHRRMRNTVVRIAGRDVGAPELIHTLTSPGAMTMAATGSVELTERITAASAEEMKIAGINWAYAASPHRASPIR